METVQSRIDDLVAQMTPQEKAGQLTQFFCLPPDAEPELALGLDLARQPSIVESALRG